MRGRDELTSVRDDAAGSELRVLVSHLALVDLLETLGDIPSELGEETLGRSSGRDTGKSRGSGGSRGGRGSRRRGGRVGKVGGSILSLRSNQRSVTLLIEGEDRRSNEL
jgi:hypothetical protein